MATEYSHSYGQISGSGLHGLTRTIASQLTRRIADPHCPMASTVKKATEFWIPTYPAVLPILTYGTETALRMTNTESPLCHEGL